VCGDNRVTLVKRATRQIGDRVKRATGEMIAATPVELRKRSRSFADDSRNFTGGR